MKGHRVSTGSPCAADPCGPASRGRTLFPSFSFPSWAKLPFLNLASCELCEADFAPPLELANRSGLRTSPASSCALSWPYASRFLVCLFVFLPLVFLFIFYEFPVSPLKRKLSVTYGPFTPIIAMVFFQKSHSRLWNFHRF